MLRSSLIVAAVTAGALVSSVTADADAFCRSTTCMGDCGRSGSSDGCKTEGAKLYWPTSCVGFSMSKQGSVHIDLETAREVMQKSFVAWSDVECADGGFATMAFAAAPDADAHVAEYNTDAGNANIILFQDNRWGYTSEDNTLAKTTVSYDTETGEIFDADIEFNHAFNEFTVGDDDVEYDLQSIATHEIGHFIGLDHTDDFLATMNAGYTRGTIDLRTLEPDDEDAVCSAYPPSRPDACDTQPNGGFNGWPGGVEPDDEGDDSCSISAAGGQSDGDAGWLLALAAAIVALSRRRTATNQEDA